MTFQATLYAAIAATAFLGAALVAVAPASTALLGL